MRELIEENYGMLFEPALMEEINEFGFFKSIKTDEQLIKIGQTIRYMPLLLNGLVKVSRLDDDGDELLLYYLEKGDVCAMTMTCCMGAAKSEIKATAEKDTELVMVPVEKMADWVSKYESWRTYVFESYNSRFKEMLESIDSLAFLNMHGRVMKYLRDKVIVSKDTLLAVTHQDIAYDLNTSRVVVSRVLKRLEKDQKLKLHRNKIDVLEF